ncbi:hypothetical protein ACV367_16495 [Pseudomonas aeruginosa]|nr:hypothetical protein [Pseudomonas aeruginosa]
MSKVKRFYAPGLDCLYRSDVDAPRQLIALVLGSDYDALAAKLAMAEDAAAKGDAARQQCGGMEMEIEELRAEAQALREEVERGNRITVAMALDISAVGEALGIPGEEQEGGTGEFIDLIRELQKEVEALRRDKARLDAIEDNCWDVRYGSSSNADAGDSSIGIEIVGYYQGAPHIRVLGESYTENLRAAIDQAMTAEAYPPERPEYDDHGRPLRALLNEDKENGNG